MLRWLFLHKNLGRNPSSSCQNTKGPVADKYHRERAFSPKIRLHNHKTLNFFYQAKFLYQIHTHTRIKHTKYIYGNSRFISFCKTYFLINENNFVVTNRITVNSRKIQTLLNARINFTYNFRI